LKEENIILKNENDLLRSQIEKLSKKLETYKNSGTCVLHLALKYLVPQAQNSQMISDYTRSGNQPELGLSLSKKKRKTLPFAWLLTENK
ncbi:5036_t:CDS:1, partial [Dentiscutata heterogama]